MGEVDTNSTKSVQAVLTLFGEKNETNTHELDRDEELESLLMGLANLKVQIESKELANKQAILKIDHYEKEANELSTRLRNSEIEKQICLNECKEARTQVHELESKVTEMSAQISKLMKTHEQVSTLENELTCKNEELLRMKLILDDSEIAKLEALRHARLIETELEMEKGKKEELMRCVSDLNQAILHLQNGRNERDQEMCRVLSEKEAEIQLKNSEAEETEEQLEDMTKKMEMNKLEVEFQIKKFSDQSCQIELLGMQIAKLKFELGKNEKEESFLYPYFENMKTELEKVKNELQEIKQRETVAQGQVTILKEEIHKGQSKIEEAEAVVEKFKSENSSLYIAVKHLGFEVEEAKTKNKILQKTENQSEDESNKICNYIRIPKEEYEALLKKIGNEKQCHELDTTKSDLEYANTKIGELRARAEQASSRALLAEKAKAKLEDQIKRWKERKERRKSAIAALRFEAIPEESTSYSNDQSESASNIQKTYQPLGEVLNMKF